MIRVKICGLTRERDVAAAVHAGADALGFNLATGPRRLDLERAAALVRRVPVFVTSVLVLVDAREVAIDAALRVTRAQAVQLHGDEPPELADRLRRRCLVIKAFRIGAPADLAALEGYPADAYLLDARVPGLFGGSGRSWDHALLAGVDLDRPWILAGGLGPANVREAVRRLAPYGVDTASGVESEPGIKDPRLLRDFVRAARGTA